jgi:hypothetical protein
MLVLVSLVCLGAAVGGDFDLDWWTVDGGGEAFSTGGHLELAGTIGQPDAGVIMTGGNLELTGGFWPLEADPCSQQLCGDCNCDGILNATDIDPFFLAIGDPASWQATYPTCNIVCAADINHDGAVNGADIDPFFEALGVGYCP